ncbi:hypothetical protein FA13DRAFT_518727 [Coprinellus micaceus]|uniref:Uncharacterized protein n=1 Tax=Coprinellus micaceus TaxID=71717 RepID=A0A4Y7TAA2_COPMI|nr:hypothetical protein FA13DRAFT_518727 [Coprinellus micaceus]
MTRRVSSHAFSCYRRRGRGNRGSRICLKRPLPAISRQWGEGEPTCRVKPTQSLEFAETSKGEVGLGGMRVVEGDERCEEELGRFCFVLTCMRRTGKAPERRTAISDHDIFASSLGLAWFVKNGMIGPLQLTKIPPRCLDRRRRRGCFLRLRTCLGHPYRGPPCGHKCHVRSHPGQNQRL